MAPSATMSHSSDCTAAELPCEIAATSRVRHSSLLHTVERPRDRSASSIWPMVHAKPGIASTIRSQSDWNW